MDAITARASLDAYYVNQIVAQIAPRMAGVEPSLLRAVAREAVAELTRDEVRLSTFVPDLALRVVRDALAHRLAAPASAPLAV